MASAAGSVVIDVGSARIVEGNATARTISVPVLLSQAPTTNVTVEYQLVGGTATGGTPTAVGADFNNAKGVKKTLTFLAGQVLKSAVVPVYADTRAESTETVRILLSGATGGAVIGAAEGTLTIVDDDPDATRYVTAGDVTTVEGDNTNRVVQLSLSLSSPATSSVTVVYNVVAGTASTPSDFSNNKGLNKSVVFAVATSGLTPVHKNIPLTVYADTTREGTESFDVRIVSVTGGAVAASDTTGTVTIIDGTESSVVEPSTPAAPTIASTVIGEIGVSWVAPANGGSAITGYGVTCVSSNGGTTRSVTATGTTTTITNATLAKSYTCTITATNSIGTSSASPASNTVVVKAPTAPVAPAAPTIASTVYGEIGVSWVAPANGGSAITGYGVACVSSNGGTTKSVTATGTTTTITNATLAKNYTCTITATNSIGTSSASPASNTVVVESRTAPDAPAAPAVSDAGYGEIVVSWVAPADGGSPITDYQVVCFSGTGGEAVGTDTTSETTEVTLENATYAEDYTCNVFASNVFGTSEQSPESETVTVLPHRIRFRQVAAGESHSCGLNAYEAITCWGDNSYGQTNTPEGRFTQIGIGDKHSCGLRKDATVTCWGSNSLEQINAPTGTFKQVDGGWEHSCGITTDQTISCWGDNSAGQADAPAGTFYQVEASWVHSCGLGTDLTITCWGNNDAGQTNAPEGTFYQVSAGDEFSCGLGSDQTITCWGANGYSQTDAPTGTFTQFDAGWAHGCAIATDQTITCWGDNSAGQTDAPTGTFTEVSASANHSCARSTSETVVCWGDNSAGQTSGPIYEFAPDSPSAPSVESIGAGEIHVWWDGPAVGSTPIASYQIICFSDNGGEPVGTDTTAGTTDITLEGATFGADYTCNVFASNFYGTSEQSAASGIVTVATPVAPDTPEAPTATAGIGEITVTWVEPADGGSPITGYQIVCFSDNGGEAVGGDLGPETTEITLEGATYGADYTCNVFASNLYGTSEQSEGSGTVTVADPTYPDTPEAPTATTAAGSGEIKVTWSAPADGGSPITGYEIGCYPYFDGERDPNNTIWVNAASDATEATLSGATLGEDYTCVFYASNLYGTSNESDPSNTVSVTPALAPEQPSAPSAVVNRLGDIEVWWDAPIDSGSPITSYEIVCLSSTGGEPVSTTTEYDTTSVIFQDATFFEEYTCTFTATNDVGTSEQSPPTDVLYVGAAPATPAAPSILAGAPGELVVTWVTPEAYGSPITWIMVECESSNGGWQRQAFPLASATTTTVIYLTRLKDYTCTVEAGNAFGYSDESPPSNVVTVKAAPPGKPATPSVTAGGIGEIVVTWVAPTNGGTPLFNYSDGSAITGFEIACFSTTDGEPVGTTAPANASTITVENASIDHDYSCFIFATNAMGTSEQSAASNAVTVLPYQYTQVSTGDRHSCALRTNQAIRCWGDNQDGQTAAPAGTFTQVSAGYDYTCGLKVDKTITCWGNNSYGQTTAPTGTFTQVSAGGSNTCGLKVDKTITCWGNNGDGQSTAPAGTFTQVSAGNRFACGLRTDTAITCWGHDNWENWTAPQGGNFTQIDTGTYHSCALWDNKKIACAGWNTSGQATAPTGTFTQVSAGDSHSCGLRTDHTLKCWGSNTYGKATAPSGSFAQVSAGVSHSCGLRVTKTITCWGNDGFGQASPSGPQFSVAPDAPAAPTISVNEQGKVVVSWVAPASNFSPISSYGVLCEDIFVDGPLSSASATTTNPNTIVEGLHTGVSYVCMVWATNSYGSSDSSPWSMWFEPTLPDPPPTAIVTTPGYDELVVSWTAPPSMAPSTSHYILAPITSYYIQCEPSNQYVAPYPEWISTTTAATARQVKLTAIGDVTYTCTVYASSAFGQGLLPFFMEPITARALKYTQVAAGENHTCALTSEGLIKCWGRNNYGQTDAPEGYFTKVTAGSNHSCAIRKNDHQYSPTTVCWGQNSAGQSPLETYETFSNIDAGSDNTCGLDDGLVSCYGSNEYGKSIKSNQSYEPLDQVTTGYNHTCGLRTADKTAVCWGSNDYAESTPAVTKNDFSAAEFVQSVDECLRPLAYGEPPDPYSFLYTGLTPDEIRNVQRSLAFISTVWEEYWVIAVVVGLVAYFSEAPIPTPDECYQQTLHLECAKQGAGEALAILDRCQNNPHGVGIGYKYRQIDSGGWNTCGLTLQYGWPVCWGYNYPGSSYTNQVCVGASWYAGLPEGEPASYCSAGNYWYNMSRWKPPRLHVLDPDLIHSPVAAFSSISTGTWSACAVHEDIYEIRGGAITCWEHANPRSSEVKYGGMYIGVSVGLNHRCGVAVEGWIACWGDNSFGQSTVPRS